MIGFQEAAINPRRAFVLIVILLTTHTLQAVAADVPALRLSDRALPVWAMTPNAYFADEQASLPLVIGDILDCTRLRAVLVQFSSKLRVEIDEPRSLNCGNGSTPASLDRPELLFEFRVPDVKRKTRFEWRFAQCGTQNDDCQSLISVPFLAYPNDLLDPARLWAKDNVLVVEDRSGQLQAFLELQEIEFFEGAAPSYSGAVRTTFVVEAERPIGPHDLARHLKRGSVVVLRERLEGLPHVKSIQRGDNRLVSVELPLLAVLRERPAAQEMFLEILRLSLE